MKNLLNEFFNSKSDANKYLTAEQQEDLEKDFQKWFLEKDRKKVRLPHLKMGWCISSIGTLVYNDGLSGWLSGVDHCLKTWMSECIEQSTLQINPHWRQANHLTEAFPILEKLAIDRGYVDGVKIRFVKENGEIAEGVINGALYWAIGSDCLAVPVTGGEHYLPVLFGKVWSEIIPNENNE